MALIKKIIMIETSLVKDYLNHHMVVTAVKLDEVVEEKALLIMLNVLTILIKKLKVKLERVLI